MGFKFRYETLLSYRGHLKERAEIALARAQQQLNQAQQRLEEYREGLRQTKQRLESGLKTRIASHELQSFRDYLMSLEGKIGIQERAVAEREKTVRGKMEDLLLKAKEYKTVEKLKERDFQEWQYRQNILEQKMMSEVALTRFGREFL